MFWSGEWAYRSYSRWKRSIGVSVDYKKAVKNGWCRQETCCRRHLHHGRCRIFWLKVESWRELKLEKVKKEGRLLTHHEGLNSTSNLDRGMHSQLPEQVNSEHWPTYHRMIRNHLWRLAEWNFVSEWLAWRWAVAGSSVDSGATAEVPFWALSASS